MSKPKPRIYLDTSVISYHAARPHRDPAIRSRQMTTKRWWNVFHEHSEFFVSTYVLDEIRAGDADAARKRTRLVNKLHAFASTPDSEQLGKRLLRDLNIPIRARMDAYHLATAALNHLDYIVSWNFKHMTSVRIREAYANACRIAGLVAPDILAPERMLEGGTQ